MQECSCLQNSVRWLCWAKAASGGGPLLPSATPPSAADYRYAGVHFLRFSTLATGEPLHPVFPNKEKAKLPNLDPAVLFLYNTVVPR